MTIVQTSRNAAGIWYDEALFQTDKRPWIGQPRPSEWAAEDFSFVVLGDRCGMATAGVFENALEIVKDLKPDFVLSVGDLIEGYWREAQDAIAEWEYIDAKIEAANLPFFHVVGNHDYGNQMMRDVWRDRKGFEYYAFRTGDILFLVLNTEDPPNEFSDDFIDIIKKATANVQNEPERMSEHMQAFYDDIVSRMSPEQLKEMGRIDLAFSDEQMAFAERVLKENRDAKWTFITMHKPGWKSEDERFERLIRMLDGRPHTVFAGHLHAMEYSVAGNGERIQLGRTGGHAHGNGPESDNLMLWVNVRNGQPSYRVIHLDGVREIGGYKPQSETEHDNHHRTEEA
ncbi:metallophosphoesterase family protein [Paenibacillus sp. NPDC058071]|uniref:metallophosphoesterase family protein n=1 Tax=Paenibacillus sp. NPDC058071 TaxID=3346326 RepID=UPI0036D90A10